MDTTIRSSLLTLTFIAVIASLYFTRDLMSPIALAVFIWLIIDAFASWIDSLSKRIPYWVALIIAIMTVVISLAGITVVVIDTAGDLIEQAPIYEARLDVLFNWASSIVGYQEENIANFISGLNLEAKINSSLIGFASSVQSVLSDFVTISIYVAFLFAAQASFPQKIEHLFSKKSSKLKAMKIFESIRNSVKRYVSVQTIISLIQTILSFAIMSVLGLENALFWSLVIFILNYIPIVGGLAAIILPLAFGIMQFESLTPILILTIGLFAVQFIIGNTIQPKMMGDSLNLSALVVVLSLTLWYALWGGVGAFLSAPLTVIVMIVFAQFSTTRWLAVLLSADGMPSTGKKI